MASHQIDQREYADPDDIQRVPEQAPAQQAPQHGGAQSLNQHLFDDRTPGVEEHEPTASYLSYTVGLGLAILATIASFVVSQTHLLWPPGIPVGLIVLAFAQIGVHLVFFLHLGSGPDSTNNILALAFGVLIVFLVITGSVWIIANLNNNMMPMSVQ